MTGRLLSKVQAAKMGFLRRLHGVTLRDKVGSSEIRKTLNVNPLFRIQRSQLRWCGQVTRMTKKDWQCESCWLHPRQSGPEVVQGPIGVIEVQSWTGPALV